MDNESDCDGLDILNDLLANEDEEEKEVPPTRTLKELDFNFVDCVSDLKTGSKSSNNERSSEVHTNELDSSDDEDSRYFEHQTYTESGRNIKHLLKKQSVDKVDRLTNTPPKKSSKSFNFDSTKKSDTNMNSKPVVSQDVYSDPFFGLRIVNPLVSSMELKNRMSNKTAVSVSKVKSHVALGNFDNDWVMAGVLINKSPTRTSQKGSSYCIWKISDLSEDVKTVSVFLFSGAYKELWKTVVGTVIGILNPNVLDSSKGEKDQATLSVDNAQKVMLFGKSKDMGTCKSTKNNGEPCSSIVNINRCEYCVYHIKKEYKKCTKRSELQSNNTTNGFSSDTLKKKTQQTHAQLPGMQPFTPVFAKRNEKLYEKDKERLALLSGTCNNSVKVRPTTQTESKQKGTAVELTSNQVKKDIDRLSKLRGWKTGTQVTTGPVDNSALTAPKATKITSTKSSSVDLNNLSSSLIIPRLGIGCKTGTIDFSEPITKKHVKIAKINAIKWVQENGKIKAKNPNKFNLTNEQKVDRGKKRQREMEDIEDQKVKKSNLLKDKFKEILQVKSNHTDLIENSDEKEKEKYFNKLEMKERMEEKMLTTYKIECKAVKCLTCKYTAFSASDLCKDQKHTLRVIDAIKRFFKCADCGNRTVSLDRIPLHSCIKCKSSNWARAAMMDEKRTNIAGVNLSLRGDEETFIGSMTKDANLNLLIPEKE